MATTKYYGEQHSRHRGQLHWPGINGIPFRGASAPTLKTHETKDMLPAGDTYQLVFDLAKAGPGDGTAEHYNWVRERARNGWFVVDNTDREWNADKTNKIVYMEWTQIYLELPPGKVPGSIEHGDHNFFRLR